MTLTSRQTLAVCVTNLGAPRKERLGVAFYNAFDAREPLQLDYLDLDQKAGTCTSFRTTGQHARIIAEAGYVGVTEDPERPIAVSAEVFQTDFARSGDVDGRDFLVWQRGGGGDGPLV
jgi:hypothetical protein